MKLTSEQLAIWETGMHDLMSSQKCTYTVDNKRITPDQLTAPPPADAGAKRSIAEVGGDVMESKPDDGGINRFSYRVRRRGWF